MSEFNDRLEQHEAQIEELCIIARQQAAWSAWNSSWSASCRAATTGSGKRERR